MEREELTAKLDPFYYKEDFRHNLQVLNSSVYPKTALGDIVQDIHYGASIPPTYNDDGTLFIRAMNIRDGRFDLSDVVYLNESVHPNLDRYRLQKDDLVMVRSGVNVGDVCRVPAELEGSVNGSYSIAFRVKSNINPEYISLFLNSKLGRLQVARVSGRSAQPNINSEEIRALRVVVPPLSVQDAVADAMDAAYRRQRALQAEAQALLDSIDGYVLSELGIKLPKLAQDQHFVQMAELVRGGRLDPYYHLPKFRLVAQALSNSYYPLKTLGKFLTDIKYGASVKNIYVQKGIPLLRITNLKPNELDLSEVVHLTSELKDAIGSAYVRENELLISRSGTIGTVAVVPKEAEGFAYGSFMIRFAVKTDLAPQYVSCFCNSPVGQMHFQRNRIGAVQGNITIPSIRALRISVPPLDRQREIAAEVQNRRQRAAALRQQATQVVAGARATAERAMLGQA